MTASNVSAFNVGTIFINQYYPVLKERPESSHQFYSESSTITWIDGAETQTAETMMDIHSLLIALNVTGVEVTNLKCQNSWNNGFLVVVSGIMRSRNFSGKRTFTQTFFLAPQESGYFVLNDILLFNEEVNQHPVPDIPDIKVDSEVHASAPLQEQPVSSNELEEETREYVNSLHIEEDSPVDKYSLSDEQQHEELQSETVVKESPVEEFTVDERSLNHVNEVEDETSAPVLLGEPAAVGEREKMSYASILRAAKGLSAQPIAPRPAVRQSMPPPPPEQRVQARAPQLNPSASSFVPEVADSGVEEAQEDVLLTSVYVKNLPLNVTHADLEKEFKKFGKIKHNGIFIRNNKEQGICYSFVEFENMSGVHNAIKASTIELLGKQVNIEERRANSSSRGGASGRGRGRGRGRGIYQSEPSRGRGSNGYLQRAYQ